MNWYLVLSPGRVYAEKNGEDIFGVESSDNPDDLQEAIKQVENYMNQHFPRRH